MKRKALQMANQAMQARGYLVVAMTGELQRGDQIDYLHGASDLGGNLDHVTVVMAETDADDWLAQLRLFGRENPLVPPGTTHFYRVAAE